jgi:cbb3-type cytochrome oxidase cytochrome c subunit
MKGWFLECFLFAVAFLLALLGLGVSMRMFFHVTAAAQETEEVKPYVFAELPHGRIYKAVHEGCEIFIVESDIAIPGGQSAQRYGTTAYSIATGRGCK